MIDIGPLLSEDRAAWELLARGYQEFYRSTVPDDGYEQTWQRLLSGPDLHGLGARLDGNLIGIAHYLFHPLFFRGTPATSRTCSSTRRPAARARPGR